MKLYEKSIVKCNFLRDVVKKCKIEAEICEGNFNKHIISSEYVVCRAFKKLGQIIDISREIIKVNHKLIILENHKLEESLKTKFGGIFNGFDAELPADFLRKCANLQRP